MTLHVHRYVYMLISTVKCTWLGTWKHLCSAPLIAESTSSSSVRQSVRSLHHITWDTAITTCNINNTMITSNTASCLKTCMYYYLTVDQPEYIKWSPEVFKFYLTGMLSGPLMPRLHLKVCQSHFRKLPQRDRHRLLHQTEPILYIASRLHLLQKTKSWSFMNYYNVHIRV